MLLLKNIILLLVVAYSLKLSAQWQTQILIDDKEEITALAEAFTTMFKTNCIPKHEKAILYSLDLKPCIPNTFLIY